jgi:ATP-dependent Clp protease ATP-binding subunit ClpA
MFERFTGDARKVVEGAVDRCERARADAVTEEDMLLAVLDMRGSTAASVLAALGVDRRREAVEGALGEARRFGGISRADAEALADLGIDVTEIVARVEGVHGRGALTAGRQFQRWSPGGHRPFAAGAKAVLVRSLRAAAARGDRRIGDEHILLALAIGPGVAADVLAEYGASPGEIERVLRDGQAGGEGRAAS